ncbi:sugar nucleotide-binding protein [Spongiibacter tropicus]|uniref:sugar nucleotide-binding protein n=1 Tax=Spongiibacter tropicus TaxID=454602 RepID=UPI0003B77C61|nr:sugar nucleotide-binding protein [Spongiibacter tropicus]
MSVLLLCEDRTLATALDSQLSSRGRALKRLSADELLADPALADGAILINALLIPGEAVGPSLPLVQKNLLSLLASRLQCYIALSDARVLEGLDADTALTENVTPAAMTVEAQRLAEMEEGLLSAPCQSLVLRAGPLIASSGENFLAALLESLMAGEVVGLRNAGQSCPTPVSDLARVLSAMVDQLTCGAPCRGIYHYQSSGSCSAYAFAEIAYAHASQYLANAPDIVEDPRGWDWPAELPVLQCERLLRNFGIKQLPWRAWLPKLIKSLCEDASNECL